MSEQVFKDPSLRILSGPPAAVELELNRLLNDYATIVWNFQPVNGEVCVSVVLMHQRELRKQQLAMPVMGNQRH